jgi:hypothetical protein
LRETLTRIGLTFLEDMNDPARREYFKIIHFESHKNPSILKAMKESPTHNREAFYAVFAKHMPKATRIDVAMFVTQFMGALVYYATLSRLRGENTCFEKLKDRDYVERLADIFVRSREPVDNREVG